MITQFKIFERRFLTYEEAVEEFIKELSRYKSIKITSEKIEFTFNDLAEETAGKCYYERFTGKMDFYLFKNYIVSYYNLEGKFFKENLDNVKLNFSYRKRNISDKVSLGTGSLYLNIYCNNIFMIDKIDKLKPITFYIEETEKEREFQRNIKKYNL
jgi:hypothetical protein